MTRILIVAFSLFMMTLVFSHVVLVRITPNLMVQIASSRLAEIGAPENAWYRAPRITAENAAVVRASPDLSYAACLLNLDGGPLRLQVPAWESYGSLSIFDGDTTNVFVGRLDERKTIDLVVFQRGQTFELPQGVKAVELSTKRGVALTRHIAPTQELFDRATAVIEASRCEQL
ncbi:MAG: DUF1254 domain-containing protein [Alphaproteobacteria bacterium]